VLFMEILYKKTLDKLVKYAIMYTVKCNSLLRVFTTRRNKMKNKDGVVMLRELERADGMKFPIVERFGGYAYSNLDAVFLSNWLLVFRGISLSETDTENLTLSMQNFQLKDGMFSGYMFVFADLGIQYYYNIFRRIRGVTKLLLYPNGEILSDVYIPLQNIKTKTGILSDGDNPIVCVSFAFEVNSVPKYPIDIKSLWTNDIQVLENLRNE